MAGGASPLPSMSNVSSRGSRQLFEKGVDTMRMSRRIGVGVRPAPRDEEPHSQIASNCAILGADEGYTHPNQEQQMTDNQHEGGRWVVVTTDKRGVFFGRTSAGYTVGDDPMVLEAPRMCVKWTEEVRGVLGLAATGPTSGCRITNAPVRIELRGITAVMDCTPEAAAAWQAAPWG